MVERYRAIGLMSGTSLDGIDVAMIETDGHALLAAGPALTMPYGPEFRARIKQVLRAETPSPDIVALERDLTDRHVDAVHAILKKTGPVDLIGFHGQTINHRPDLGWTWQLGDGPRLAKAVGIDTVYDFRGADVAAGGQGAPLAPVYHQALARSLEMPVIVLNLGGVANVTLLRGSEQDPTAFDTGPASALLDDWISQHNAGSMDADGAISSSGSVKQAALAALLENPYFSAPYPKSLDRLDFNLSPVQGLSLEDGAATLAAFTIESVGLGIDMVPEKPRRVLVTGGGRHNPTLMTGLAKRLGIPVQTVEAVGWQGDALEAQAFAFMAVRSQLGLPLSFPQTTGVPEAITGGQFAKAPSI